MVDVSWAKALLKLEEYVFKILTPNGSGTGFLILISGDLYGIATSYHVIEHEYTWEEPIKIQHFSTGKQVLLKTPDDRFIFPYPDEDLAFILFPKGDLILPTKTLEMIRSEKHVRKGVQMGWCGFPNIASTTLCFFTGHVSAFLESSGAYLVDGVAINGVSGGPAFTVRKNTPRLCGVVAAYIANRATGETLPGVCLIRDVAPYQETLSNLKSIEEAEKQAKSESLEQQQGKGPQKPKSEEPPKKKVMKKKRPKKKKVVKKKTLKKKMVKKKVKKTS